MILKSLIKLILKTNFNLKEGILNRLFGYKIVIADVVQYLHTSSFLRLVRDMDKYSVG